MSLLKKFPLALLIIFIAIQFIQPARNKSGQLLQTDILRTYNVPDSVHAVIETACYDCHSNHTIYPWYFNVQPMAWVMANHIKNGKADLNFSEFGSYSTRKQKSKLQAIANSLKDGTMPLSSYTLIHKNANLSKKNKALIIDWASKTEDTLTSKKIKS